MSTFSVGGAERSTYNLACGMQAKGYDVTVVVLRGEGEFARYFNQSLHVVDLQIPLKPAWLMRPYSIISIIRFLNDFKSKVDILFCSHIPTLAVAVGLALMLLRINKIRKFQIERNTFSGALQCSHPHSLWGNIRAWIIKTACRCVYPYFTKIIAVSDGVQKDILQHNLTVPDKVIRIYNPVVTREQLQPIVERSESTGKMILGIGALETRKGFHVLIQAFAKILPCVPDGHLVIVGEGRQRPKLEDTIRTLNIVGKVSMVGYQEDPFSWYRRASVFVLASEEEGLPRVLVEAMACGLTPVSTDCKGDGAREILENGRYGYMVPVGDVDAMAQAILNALEKPLDPDLLRERASYFSVENSIKQYIDLIETCA